MRQKWKYLFLFFLNIQIVCSATIYVKYDAVGANNGSSWTNAYTSFQSALDIATSGDQIWVARGTYKPSYDYGRGGVRYNHFRMIDGVAIYGGFTGTETSTSQRVNYGEDEANETILSGDLNSNGADNSDAYHIFFHPNGLILSNSAILNGFSLVLGNANANILGDEFLGGAIYNYLNNKTPVFENIVFKNNSAIFGSVIFSESSSPIFSNCHFKNNSGNGAITDQWGSNTEIYNSIFSNNNGNAYRGYQSCNPKLTNVLIYNNASVNVGGGFELRNDCIGIFTNVTITKNSGPDDGGGLYLQYDCSITFYNSIIYGNTSPGTGDDIKVLDNSSIILNYSCYNNSSASIALDGTSTLTVSNNNITSDPLFVDLANDDYRLSKTSPCLDAGNNSYNSETYDIRGNYPRKLYKYSYATGTIDIGAYEFRAGYDAIVITTNSATNIETDAAISGAELFADLFTPIIAKGIVWDTLSTPTISLSNKTNEGTANGFFSSNLTGLVSNTTYYIRSYVTTVSGTTYGDEVSFVTNYGIDEDGNQDGILDTLEPHVFTIFDENTDSFITIESLENDSIFDVFILKGNENDYLYPLGLMSFKVKASFANIKIYYHGVSSLENYTYRKQKLDGTFYDYTRAIFAIQTINGNPTAVVTLSLIDGGLGDNDRLVNGIIYDPGGPAISTVAIPTLSEWARIILISLLLILGFLKLRDYV